VVASWLNVAHGEVNVKEVNVKRMFLISEKEAEYADPNEAVMAYCEKFVWIPMEERRSQEIDISGLICIDNQNFYTYNGLQVQ
jgi:hypothetical protein